jgi:hypothetical protein
VKGLWQPCDWSTGRDVAVATIQSVGTDAEQDDLVGMSLDDPARAGDVAAKGALVANVMVAREDRDGRIGVAAGELEQTHQHTDTRVEVPRLDDQIPGKQRGELRPSESQVCTVDDNQPPLAGHQRRNAVERRLVLRQDAGRGAVAGTEA